MYRSNFCQQRQLGHFKGFLWQSHSPEWHFCHNSPTRVKWGTSLSWFSSRLHDITLDILISFYVISVRHGNITSPRGSPVIPPTKHITRKVPNFRTWKCTYSAELLSDCNNWVHNLTIKTTKIIRSNLWIKDARQQLRQMHKGHGNTKIVLSNLPLGIFPL